jgi:hypothetical protein
MIDVLRDALRAEGLDDDAIARVKSYLYERDYEVSYNWRREEIRRKIAIEQEKKAAEQERVAAAVLYAGAIKRCQAHAGGWVRSDMGGHRCNRKPTLVVRRKERPGEKYAALDGRLAVCRTHASKRDSGRYHGRWSHEQSAIEPVELEYQPTAE